MIDILMQDKIEIIVYATFLKKKIYKMEIIGILYEWGNRIIKQSITQSKYRNYVHSN